MAREQGSYKGSHFATLAAARTAIDAWLATVDVAVGTATSVSLSLTINVFAENGGGDPFTHKYSRTHGSNRNSDERSDASSDR